MKKTHVKIIGICVCLIFLGTVIPSAVAETQTEIPSIQPTGFIHYRLLVFGHLSNYIILDNTIIGHADQLIYFGKGLLHQDRGIITNQEIILQMSSRYHIWTYGTDLILLGQCLILI